MRIAAALRVTFPGVQENLELVPTRGLRVLEGPCYKLQVHVKGFGLRTCAAFLSWTTLDYVTTTTTTATTPPGHTPSLPFARRRLGLGVAA